MKECSKILVVEDIPNLRGYLVETLQDMGPFVVVHEAGDGLEALEVIDKEGPFDLILSDISMPRMNGEELLECLAERDDPAAIIIVTAYGQDQHVLRCMQGGACDYLVKPVDVDDLVVSVTNALQHGPMKRIRMDVSYDQEGWFEITAQSDYSVLYRFRRFLSLLDMFSLSEKDAEGIRLALEELGRNAIEWGNQGDPTKRVRFGCRILPTKVIIQIADEGSGFIPEEVPDPTADPIAHMDNRKSLGKRMGGYGVHLIRHMMDKLVYNERGNVVVAIKYLNQE